MCLHVSGEHMLHRNVQALCNPSCCDAIQFVKCLLFSNMQSLIHHSVDSSLLPAHILDLASVFSPPYTSPSPSLHSYSPSVHHLPAMHPQHFAVEYYCFSSPLSPLPSTRLSVRYYTPTRCHFLRLILLNCSSVRN